MHRLIPSPGFEINGRPVVRDDQNLTLTTKSLNMVAPWTTRIQLPINAFSEKETEELSASKKTRAEAELSKPKQNARSMRTFQTQWKKGRQWLNFSVGTNSMTCLYCLDYNTGGGRGEITSFQSLSLFDAQISPWTPRSEKMVAQWAIQFKI